MKAMRALSAWFSGLPLFWRLAYSFLLFLLADASVWTISPLTGTMPGFYPICGFSTAAVLIGGLYYMIPAALATFTLSLLHNYQSVDSFVLLAISVTLADCLRLWLIHYFVVHLFKCSAHDLITTNRGIIVGFLFVTFFSILGEVASLFVVLNVLASPFFPTFIEGYLSLFIGNVLSTLLFGPMIICFSDSNSYKLDSFARIVPYYICLLVAALSIWRWQTVQEIKGIQDELKSFVDLSNYVLTNDLEQIEQAFVDIDTYINELDDEQFALSSQKFVGKITKKHAFLTSLAWAPAVSPKERSAYESKLFPIKTLGDNGRLSRCSTTAQDLYPISYVVGASGEENRLIRGMDMSYAVKMANKILPTHTAAMVILPDLFRPLRKDANSVHNFYAVYPVKRHGQLCGLLVANIPVQQAVESWLNRIGLYSSRRLINLEILPVASGERAEAIFAKKQAQKGLLVASRCIEVGGLWFVLNGSFVPGHHLEHLQSYFGLCSLLVTVTSITLLMIFSVSRSEAVKMESSLMSSELRRKDNYYEAITSAISEGIFCLDDLGQI